MTIMVSVQVPEEHVMAVYRFLGSLEAGGSHAEAATEAALEEALDEGGAEWTAELVRRAVTEGSDRFRRAMVLIAESGDEGITTDELASELEYENGANAIAGMLGAAQRRCRNRYGVTASLWTRQWEWYGEDDESDGGTSRVKMTATIREWVLEA